MKCIYSQGVFPQHNWIPPKPLKDLTSALDADNAELRLEVSAVGAVDGMGETWHY